MTQQDTPTPISLDGLRAIREQLTPFRLPDASARAGHDVTVMLRRLHPMQLAAQGVLPEGLAGIALASLGLTTDAEQPERRDVKEVSADYLAMLAATCAAVIAEPAMDRDDVAGALSHADQEAVFAHSNASGEELARFRSEPDGDVAGVDGGTDVAVPTQ